MSIESPSNGPEIEQRSIRRTSYAHAIEHALWCAGQGMTPRAVIKSVGMGWTAREPSWDDAVYVLAFASRRRGGGYPRPAPDAGPRVRVRATPTEAEIEQCRRAAIRRAPGRAA